MKITKISVKGLFGIFDHEIPLNTEERITIIHGLNGFGKTNILKMLNGILNYQYDILFDIPFDSFKINLNNDNSLLVKKIIKNTKRNNKHCNILFDFIQTNSETLTFTVSQKVTIPEIVVPTYFESSTMPITDTSPTVQFGGADFIVRKRKASKNNIPQWLIDIRRDNNIKLIESQRLLDSNSMSPTVDIYSKEIAEFMQNKFTEYGATSQSLDRTFPVRAVKQQPSPDLTDKQLREQLNELEKTRSRLVEVGLLDKDENQDFPTQPEDINESARSILSVYVEDVKQKLSIFDDIAKKIDLLRKIINRKFAYSYKEMNFSKEQGFIFTACYPNASKSESKTLSPTDLSSGEQHELVLLYELLFKVEPNSLVLIDEPELSLHVGWQSQFLKDLKEITELADLDILMATHSPDIIQDRWDDLTVELKAPKK